MDRPQNKGIVKSKHLYWAEDAIGQVGYLSSHGGHALLDSLADVLQVRAAAVSTGPTGLSSAKQLGTGQTGAALVLGQVLAHLKLQTGWYRSMGTRSNKAGTKWGKESLHLGPDSQSTCPKR